MSSFYPLLLACFPALSLWCRTPSPPTPAAASWHTHVFAICSSNAPIPSKVTRDLLEQAEGAAPSPFQLYMAPEQVGLLAERFPQSPALSPFCIQSPLTHLTHFHHLLWIILGDPGICPSSTQDRRISLPPLSPARIPLKPLLCFLSFSLGPSPKGRDAGKDTPELSKRENTLGSISKN